MMSCIAYGLQLLISLALVRASYAAKIAQRVEINMHFSLIGLQIGFLICDNGAKNDWVTYLFLVY